MSVVSVVASAVIATVGAVANAHTECLTWPGDRLVWVVGSVHAGLTASDLSSDLQRLLRTSNAVYFEVASSARLAMREALLLQESPVLSEEAVALLGQVVDALVQRGWIHADVAPAVKAWPPFAVALTADALLTDPAARAGFALEELVEHAMGSHAANVQSLERTDDYRELGRIAAHLDWIPYFADLLRLVRCDECIVEVREASREEIGAVRRGDLAALRAAGERRSRYLPRDEVRRLLHDMRNPTMAARLAEVVPAYPDGSRLVVVVGAGHLLGEGSIIEHLLAQRPNVHRCTIDGGQRAAGKGTDAGPTQ